ncbi:MAG: metal transporter [Gemmatimonadales bacterium]|nr:metal transporter [Gemmatimonadales bacterium]
MTANRWWWAFIPLGLLAALIVLVTQTGLLDRLRGPFPPVEVITVERVRLLPGRIELGIANAGPDPVTIAQVSVDEAFWNFTMSPSQTLGRFGRATVVLDYPWVENEAHVVSMLTSTGLTFEHGIALAVTTPVPTKASLWTFTLIGLYVGVIPVAIGLLFLPLIRRLSKGGLDFSLALTAGLLIFLGADALFEALENARAVPATLHGSALVVMGSVGTFLLLQLVGGSRARAESADGRRSVAWLIALSIGLHNLGEGLAIGAAYAIGEVSLGAFLIVGFMLHNTTEGLAIVAPVARDRPRLITLAAMGALAGIPTILGAWIGGYAFTATWATLFLAIGVGAIAQVVVALFRMFSRGEEPMWRPAIASGVLAGLLVMYATGLLVA